MQSVPSLCIVVNSQGCEYIHIYGLAAWLHLICTMHINPILATWFAINTCTAKHVSRTRRKLFDLFLHSLQFCFWMRIIHAWNFIRNSRAEVLFGLLFLKWFWVQFIVEGGRRVKAIMGQYSFIVHSMKFIWSIMFSFVFFWLLWSCQLEGMGGGFPKSLQAMEDQDRR